MNFQDKVIIFIESSSSASNKFVELIFYFYSPLATNKQTKPEGFELRVLGQREKGKNNNNTGLKRKKMDPIQRELIKHYPLSIASLMRQ